MATPSTIPGSDSLSSLYSQILQVNNLYSGNILATSNTISGLSLPVNESDASNKEYVDNTFRINKTTTIINNNSSITYNGSSIVGGIIQRNMQGSDRTDKFPSASEIISSMSGTSTNLIECIIQNMSTLSEFNILVVDLFQEGITVVSPIETSVVINPYSIVTFTILITSTSTVDIYYNKTFSQDLTNNFYYDQNAYSINIPIRTTNIFSQKTGIKTITTSGLIPASSIINTIITRTTVAGTDTFPTSTSILSTLGITNNIDTWGFQTVIRNQTGSAIQISSNTGITFDFSEPFLLGIDNSITFFTKYNGSGFTVYIIKITSFDTLCVIQ
jgi:hypothetical protein